MRIVAGKYGGRRLETPKGSDIRPTSDKVRGAIFNALQARGLIEGAHVLDGFCGSGALGLEALSRGAVSCVFIDNHPKSIELCKANIENLDAEGESEVILKDAAKAGHKPGHVNPADLVFLDPPYNKGLIDKALLAFRDGCWLSDDVCCVCEMERSGDSPNVEGFELLDEKIYGDTKVLFMQASQSK